MPLRLLAFIVVNLMPLASYATCIGLGCTCSATSNPIPFGTYAPLSGTALTMNGNIAVTCSALLVGLNVSYVITLNKGSSSTYTPRVMLHGAAQMQYNLYTSPQFASIWGDGTGGTVSRSDAYLLNLLSVTRNYVVYGNVPGSQNLPTGNYQDNITATVTY